MKLGISAQMKTTVDIPDALLKRAKSAAAERGIPLRELVSEALAEKLRVNRTEERPWMKSFGKLRVVRKESERINRIIEEEFENVELEG
jgi:metal-responsive CopG/Arc/MetJ family transcriptional regulator